MPGPADRVKRLLLRTPRSDPLPEAVLGTPSDETTLDPETGAVTSKQSAEILLPTAELDRLWVPENLERLARTYWSTLRRFTLGLMHVDYTETERSVVFLFSPLRLLTFSAPEYEMDRCRGLVRWQIDRGLLVSRRGRGGGGYLGIEVERHDRPESGQVALRVTVEVANYYPKLSGISRRIYVNTQSRIHVFACTFFLRRLIRRNLDESRVGRLAGSAKT
jgi:hypothetical protein